MIKYTFTFGPEQEKNFRNVLARLEPEEYNILEEICMLKPEEPRYSDRQTVMEMDPEACLTFRLGMKEVKIRRERTEEELAEEKEIDDQNTVRITIKVNGVPGTTTP
jgi:hypothetical protein